MNHKRISFAGFLESFRSVLVRFPFPLVLSLAGTIVAIVLIHVDDSSSWTNIMMVLSLATPVSVVLVLFAEGMGWNKGWVWIFNAVLVSLMVGYYYLLPESAEQLMPIFFRHVMWTFAFVLAVTFVAFVRQHGEMAVARFWEFCRRLMVATILTGVWAFALQMGLMAALSSTDYLFSLTIPDARYTELFAIVAGIFCTTFFLSRVPRQPAELHADLAYPKEVRLFSTFVLVPLVTVYFLILYLYTGKILLTGEWPEGQLAYIILGFSVVGLLTYLALYPLRKEVAWVRVFGTALCVALIPQALMLFWSLWFRVSDYGLTENRYLVFVYGAWLIGVSLYLLISRMKDIRLVPVSLFVLALVTSIGPWGAFSVAIHSQANRLEQLLEANDRFQNGMYVIADSEVSDKDLYEMSEVLRFLGERDAMWVVEPWLNDGQGLLEVARWDQAAFVMEEGFGLDFRWYVPQSGEEVVSDRFNVEFDQMAVAVQTDDYDFVFDYTNYTSTPISIDGRILKLNVNSRDERINLTLDGEMLGYVPLSEFIDWTITRKSYPTPSLEEMTILVDTNEFSAKIVVSSLQGVEKDDDRVQIDYFFARFFLTLKE